MKILVTGGAGYIGSVASALLIEAGHEVWVMDNLSRGHQNAIATGVTRHINASVSAIAKHCKATDGIDAVIHLGAYMAAGESMTKPELYWQNNVAETLELLDGMRSLSIKKMVFASTAAVYGNPVAVPIHEDAAKNPESTYGMTKLAIDMAITSESYAHKLAAASLRFFNVAGAYKRYGERHPDETHIIPLAFRALETGEFTIFGGDYDTPDGTCIRDYIHVVDLVQAMILALEKTQQGSHDIYNLGNGRGFSNKEILSAVKRVTGQKLHYEIGPRRAGDSARLIASSDKAKQQLGWKPIHTDLDTIVTDAWNFYQERRD